MAQSKGGEILGVMKKYSNNNASNKFKKDDISMRTRISKGKRELFYFIRAMEASLSNTGGGGGQE